MQHPAPLPLQRAIRREATGLQYAVARHPIATVLCATSQQGLCAVLLGPDASAVIALLQQRFGPSPGTDGGVEAHEALEQVLRLMDGEPAQRQLRLHLIGTAFERLVWQALAAIPKGQVVTYGALAAAIGRPKAARAVGAACGRNNLAVVVPCHRVGYKGSPRLHYRWGSNIKKQLLMAEGAPLDCAAAGQQQPLF